MLFACVRSDFSQNSKINYALRHKTFVRFIFHALRDIGNAFCYFLPGVLNRVDDRIRDVRLAAPSTFCCVVTRVESLLRSSIHSSGNTNTRQNKSVAASVSVLEPNSDVTNSLSSTNAEQQSSITNTDDPPSSQDLLLLKEKDKPEKDGLDNFELLTLVDGSSGSNESVHCSKDNYSVAETQSLAGSYSAASLTSSEDLSTAQQESLQLLAALQQEVEKCAVRLVLFLDDPDEALASTVAGEKNILLYFSIGPLLNIYPAYLSGYPCIAEHRTPVLSLGILNFLLRFTSSYYSNLVNL